MIYLIALFVGILPAIMLVCFIYWKDRYVHEPWKWVLKAFFFGVLSSIPAIIIELLLPDVEEDSFLHSAYSAFIVASMSEEAMKMLFFWLLVRKNPYFDERMDGIVYCAAVGLGFAGLENMGYMLSNLDQLASVAIMRAFVSVPGHFFFAVFMGYYYSLAVYGPKEKKKLMLVAAFVVPFILHGLFDFALMSFDLGEVTACVMFVLFVVLFIFMWRHSVKKMNKLLEDDFFAMLKCPPPPPVNNARMQAMTPPKVPDHINASPAVSNEQPPMISQPPPPPPPSPRN